MITASLGAANSKADSGTATTITDTGVANRSAAHDVATLLGVPGAVIVRKPVAPNKLGWTPPVALEVTLGTDYASNTKTH